MVAHQFADDADRSASVEDADVHVHSADQHPSRRPLQILDEIEVALVRG